MPEAARGAADGRLAAATATLTAAPAPGAAAPDSSPTEPSPPAAAAEPAHQQTAQRIMSLLEQIGAGEYAAGQKTPLPSASERWLEGHRARGTAVARPTHAMMTADCR